MKITTKFLGEIEISEQDILKFEHGLLGLEDEKKFVLLPLDADLPLAMLQSINNAEIGFVVAFPFAFKKKIIALILAKRIVSSCKLKNKRMSLHMQLLQ